MVSVTASPQRITEGLGGQKEANIKSDHRSKKNRSQKKKVDSHLPLAGASTSVGYNLIHLPQRITEPFNRASTRNAESPRRASRT